MTITARVHNRTITLPPDIDVEDGVEVRVTLPEANLVAQPAGDAMAWLRRARGTATSGLTTAAILQMTRADD